MNCDRGQVSVAVRARRWRPGRRFLPLAGLAAAAAAGVLGVSGGARAASNACPTSNSPNEIVIEGGSGQTAQLGKQFATSLQVKLANSNGCPLTGNLAGYDINFDAPGGGASGLFAGSGSREAVIGTDAQGVATAPPFTANFTAGAYTVDAHSDFGSVEFYLSNSAAGLATSITAGSGTPQAATLNSQYPQPLQARVTDANGNPVQGATVSFSIVAGATGASASFLGAAQATATTNSDGIATSLPLLANGVPGRFTAVASTDGVSIVAAYKLDNHAAANTITAGGDTRQNATVDTRYTRPLTARLLDPNGQPIEGASITFTISQADNGAGATFVGAATQVTVLTDANGEASSPRLLANKTAGIFTATATSIGAAEPTTYTLKNIAARPNKIVTGAADGQSARCGSALPIRLAVAVTDKNGNPVSGATVTFAAPARGPGGRFRSTRHPHTEASKRALRIVRVPTDTAGVAIAPAFVTNHKSGGYVVTARAGGQRVAFALVNTPR